MLVSVARTASVVQAAAALGGGVAAEGAIGQGQAGRVERAEVSQASAPARTGVVADGAVRHRERAAVVEQAAAADGVVAADGAAFHRECAVGEADQAAADTGLAAGVLSLTVQSVIVSPPSGSTCTPPPSSVSVSALPPVIVRPKIDAMTLASTWKTRPALLPLTDSRFAPGPVIVTVPLSSSSWLPSSVIVWGVAKTVGSNVIASVPPSSVSQVDGLAQTQVAGWRAGAVDGGVDHQGVGLEGADVGPGRGEREAPLVGGGGAVGCALADRRAAREQGHGRRRPAVVAQRGQQRVAADQVVAAQIAARDVAVAIAGDDRVGQRTARPRRC